MKILLVSSIWTHPADEGNRQRILQTVNVFERMGHTVHMALLPSKYFRKGDLDLLEDYWGDRLHVLSKNETWSARIFNKACKIAGAPLRGWQVPPALAVLASDIADLDYPFFRLWSLQLWMLQKRHNFNVVLVEYVFYSKAFFSFDSNVRRILDSHDLFHDRDAYMANADPKAEKWLSTSLPSECTAFDRADDVLAIQQQESTMIKSMTTSRVWTVGHVPDWCASEIEMGAASLPTILFIGSNNLLNAQGCLWFIREVLPLVQADIPHVIFRVVGSVEKAVTAALIDSGRATNAIAFAGRVDDLAREYEQAHVVINPVLLGTGLPIKTIEALAFGKPVVCTSSGARGLGVEPGLPLPCEVTDDAVKFAQTVMALLSDEDRRRELAQRALDFVRVWRQTHLSTLEQLVM